MWKRVPGNCPLGASNFKNPHFELSLEESLMHSWLAADRVTCVRRGLALMAVLAVVAFAFVLPAAHAQQAPAPAPTLHASTAAPVQAENAPAGEAGGEANLTLPDMTKVSFLNGVSGFKLLAVGLIFC